MRLVSGKNMAVAALCGAVSLLGLLSAAPGFATAPFVIETADPSTHFVGQYTSLALDGLGQPNISYYDNDDGNLKYAHKSGASWVIEVADPSTDDVGLFTSIALDGSGNP